GGTVVQSGGRFGPGRLRLPQPGLPGPLGRPGRLRLGGGLLACPVALPPGGFGIGDVFRGAGPLGIPFADKHLELALQPVDLRRGGGPALAGGGQLLAELDDEPLELLPHRAPVDAGGPLPASGPQLSDAPQGAVNHTDRISHRTAPSTEQRRSSSPPVHAIPARFTWFEEFAQKSVRTNGKAPPNDGRSGPARTPTAPGHRARADRGGRFELSDSRCRLDGSRSMLEIS